MDPSEYCRISASLRKLYPKSRPILPPKYLDIYSEEYLYNRHGKGVLTGVAARLEKWMHRKVTSRQTSGPLLELGAGTLNHVPWECDVEKYDIVEPFDELYKNSPNLDRINRIFPDISQIPLGSSYSRIISVATLEHVLDLPELVARSGLLLREGGRFLAGVPSEGGILWYVGWRFGTGLDFFFRRRLDYRVFMRHEHVNSVMDIIAVIKIFFSNVTVKYFPFGFVHGSIYTYIDASEPEKAFAAHFLGYNNLKY